MPRQARPRIRRSESRNDRTGQHEKKKEGAGLKANSFRTEQIGGNLLLVLQIFRAGGEHVDCVNHIVKRFTYFVQHVVTI